MSNLELMKTLIGMDISDSKKDTILNFYLSKSKIAIQNYLNVSDLRFTALENELANSIVELGIYYYKNNKSTGLKNESEGNRSKSYENEGIPSFIKTSLPLPRISLM